MTGQSSGPTTNQPADNDFILCFARGALIRILIFAVIVVLIVFERHIFLIAFAGILLAVVLRAISNFVARRLRLSSGWAYATTLISITVIVLGACYLLGPRVFREGHEIIKAIPASVSEVRDALQRYEWGRDITHLVSGSMQGHEMTGTAKNIATDSVNALTDAIVILALGVFMGATPAPYRRGLLYLVPAKNRQSVGELFGDITIRMRNWMLGQLIPMAALGVGTCIGLSLLGIPLAFTLALFTAFMLFIPYVGSVLAFIPTVLIAFTKSPESALYVTILYLGVHAAEGYVVTPMAQKWMVRMPPALTLFSQLFMWKVAGLLGVLVATPLASVVMLVVNELYTHKAPELRR